MTPEKAYVICINENKRKPELETVILTDPCYSYFYARDVIQDRWTEAESIILTSSELISRDVIKGRWTEVERFIRKDKDVWESYRNYFKINRCRQRKV